MTKISVQVLFQCNGLKVAEHAVFDTCVSFTFSLKPLIVCFAKNLISGFSFQFKCNKLLLMSTREIFNYFLLKAHWNIQISCARLRYFFFFNSSVPSFLMYFRTQFRDTLMSGSREIGVFLTQLFCKWVLWVTKKNLRFSRFFSWTPFLHTFVIYYL